MSSLGSRRARPQMQALLACSGLALVLVILVPVSPSAASGRHTVRIGLFGDSLAVQSEPYFNLLVQADGKASVTDFAYGGTAACDWLSKMRKYARTEHPQAVVFEFVGNTFTSCMKGCRFGSRAAVALYCSTISTAINVFLGLGTHVFLIGTPITRAEWMAHDSDWDALNAAFAALAAKRPARVTYVDAGKAVEGPHQSYVSDVAVPLLRGVHRPDDRRSQDQRGSFTRRCPLLSGPDRQRSGDGPRLRYVQLWRVSLCHGNGGPCHT